MIDAKSIKGLETIPAGDMPVRKPAPVDSWHPGQSAPIDIRIDADGRWFHDGEPIRRAGLVALFASILRGEEDGSYVLVTPAEKRTIKVLDVPFVAVGISVHGVGKGQVIMLMTNVGEEVAISPDHPLRFAQSPAADDIALPYVTVRGRLEARVGRAVFPDLVELGCVETHEEKQWFGVWSSGKFWPMMLADEAGA
jgi:hypothetical protein